MKRNSVVAGTVEQLDTEGLGRLVEGLLEEAARCGASAAEVAADVSSGLSLTVRKGELETLEFTRDRGMGVTVYFGRRKGSASTTEFSGNAVRETVRAACEIARRTAEDACHGLAPAERMAWEPPDLALWHPWELTLDEAVELARACEAAALSESGITNSEGASLNTHAGYHVYGNSHGFVGAYPATRHSMSCTVIAGAGNGMQRDYWYTSSRDPEGLLPPEVVGRRAAERTVMRLGARRLSTRRVPVVFSAETARTLLSHFVAAIRGGALYRKASFLMDGLGKAIFPAFVRIHEQPLLKGALGSAPFDQEGVSTRPRAIVAEGVLGGFVLDSYSACKLGMETTGNAGGVHNLTIDAGWRGSEGKPPDLKALLQRMGNGILITELMGQGVRLITGDYSRGAAGFWVENGEIAYPVEEFTIAGNLKEMYQGLVAVADDMDCRGTYRSGSWLVEQMTVAGDY